MNCTIQALMKWNKTIKTVIILGIFTLLLVGCSNYEEKEEIETIKKNEIEQTENNQLNNADIIKGLTDEEQKYFDEVLPTINLITGDIKKIIEYKSDSHENLDLLLQEVIDKGNYLAELKSNDNIKIIRDLVNLYGYTNARACEKFLEAKKNNDKESLKFAIEGISEATNYLHELRFYSVYGEEIRNNIDEDIKELVGESNYNGITLYSGTNNLLIIFNVDYSNDMTVLKNNSLMKINDILIKLDENEYYNYLNTTIGVQTKVKDNNGELKNWIIVTSIFESNTRNKIKFNNTTWKDIPNIANEYQDKF